MRSDAGGYEPTDPHHAWLSPSVNLALAIGATLPLAACTHPSASVEAGAVAMGILCAIIAWLSRWRASRALGAYALLIAIITFAWWCIALAAPALDWRNGLRVSAEAIQLPLFTHPAFVFGMIATGLLALACWAGRAQTRAIFTVGCWVVGVLFFLCTTLEVARGAPRLTSDPLAQGAAVSIYWAILAVALLAGGFASRIAIVRHVGLGLLGVAALKAVVFDLQGVSQEWRIVSLVAVGLLMLGVSLTYAKVAARLKQEAKP